MSSIETDDDSGAAAVLFPTIHVLSSFAHTHPLDTPANGDSPDGLSPMSPIEWKETRAELVTLLAQLGLDGEDEWVGEWVLAALCQKNAPPLTPLSVALLAPSPAGSDSAAPPALPLLYVLEQLVPTLHPLDLSIPLLNAGSFAPRAREKEEDLEAGAWQVPKGGVGYVRESAMGEGGKLNARGASLGLPDFAFARLAADWRRLTTYRHRQPADARQPRSAPDARLPVPVLGLLVCPGSRLPRRGRRQGRHAPPRVSKLTLRGNLSQDRRLTAATPNRSQVDVKIKLQVKSDPSERKTREQVAAALPPKTTLDRFRAIVARAKAGSLTVPHDVSEVRCCLSIL